MKLVSNAATLVHHLKKEFIVIVIRKVIWVDLIYTSDGDSEGSLGGLAGLGKPEN